MKKFLLAAMVSGLFMTETLALAEPVAVVSFDGAKKKSVGSHVVSALKDDGVEVVEVGRPAGDDDGAYRALAEEHGAMAVVTGETTMSKKGWVTVVTVRGADGAVIGEQTLKGAWLPGLLKEIDKNAAAALAPALGQAAEQLEAEKTPEPEEAPEPEPEPEPVSTPPEEDRAPDEADDDDAADDARPSPIGVRVGVRVFYRDFSYNQDVNSNLRPYRIDPSPAPLVALEYYPGAHFTDNALADIGVVGSFEQSIGATSGLEGGNESFDTTMRSFDVGLRYRLRLGKHEVGISGRYASHAFEIDGDADPAARSAAGMPLERDLLPDVSYGVIRPGLDTRLTFGSVTVGAHAGYRIVQSMGDMTSEAWFPNATASAVDAGLYGGYTFGGGFGALIGFDLVRYGLDMQSSPDDLALGRDVAGGAVDQYLSGWAGLEWRPAGS